MTQLPPPIAALAAALHQLPGIGPRTAERLALHLAQSTQAAVQTLADAILQARQRVALCLTCGSLTELQPCPLCTDPRRDPALLCVVERPLDVLALEKSGAFRGRYHVLGGRIAPLDGVGPEDLRFQELERRLDSEPIREVIVALGADVEGEATSFYLARRLAGRPLAVTRIAQGLPAGGGLEFADDLTLSRALEGRRAIG